MIYALAKMQSEKKPTARKEKQRQKQNRRTEVLFRDDINNNIRAHI